MHQAKSSAAELWQWCRGGLQASCRSLHLAAITRMAVHGRKRGAAGFTNSASDESPMAEEFFLPGSGASLGLTSADLEASRTATWDDAMATMEDIEAPGQRPTRVESPAPLLLHFNTCHATCCHPQS